MAVIQTSKAMLLREMFPWLSDAAWEQVWEYAPTFLTEFAVMVCQIMVYKLAAHFLGKQGFSEYAIIRRTVSFMSPIPLLGLGVGLPRFIAHSTGRGDNSAAHRYFGAAVWCVCSAVFLCMLAMNIGRNYFALLFFGERAYAFFVFPISIMVLGFVLHSIGYAYFRGHMAMKRANIMQFVNLGLAPLIGFLAFRHSVWKLVLFVGSSWSVVASLALSSMPLRNLAARSYIEAKELVRYGVQRVPGDFMLVALTTLPVALVAHRNGVQAAGFAAFGISVLSMVGAVFAPIGLILLPKASRLLASGDFQKLRKHVVHVTALSMAVAVLIFATLELLSPTLLILYLGTGYTELIPIIRILAVATVPYSAYFVWRGLVDAFHVRAINAQNVGIALAAYLVSSAWFGRAQTTAILVIPVVIGLCVLGGLTARETYKIWSQQISPVDLSD